MYLKSGGTKIYYTTDGGIPTKGRKGTKRYSSKGITVKESQTIRARSYKKEKKSVVSRLTVIILKPVKIKEIGVKKGKYVSVSWKSAKYVDGYYIYRKSPNSSWKKVRKIKGIGNCSYLDKNVKDGNKYSYIIIPYKDNKKAKFKKKYLRSIKVKCTHKIESIVKGYYTIEKCKICGQEFKKYLAKDIPSYWNDEIVNALDTAKCYGKLPGYIFLTDSHWRTNAKNSPAIINYICGRLNNIPMVFGGDVIYGHSESLEGAKNEILDFYSKFSVRVFSTTGNHDFNREHNNNQDTFLTSADLYPLMYQREGGYACLEGGSDYSYMDDYENRIRIISFLYDDTMRVSDNTIEWIGKRIKELPGDWTIVLVSHAYWTYRERGFNLEVKSWGRELASKLLSIQNESDAKIALWQVGHVHRDYSEEIRDGDASIRVVSTSCDNYNQSTRWGGPQMTKGTATEQTMDIVQFDRNNRKIYMTRVGAGIDRVFSY